jgi:hypothetical protein
MEEELSPEMYKWHVAMIFHEPKQVCHGPQRTSVSLHLRSIYHRASAWLVCLFSTRLFSWVLGIQQWGNRQHLSPWGFYSGCGWESSSNSSSAAYHVCRDLDHVSQPNFFFFITTFTNPDTFDMNNSMNLLSGDWGLYYRWFHHGQLWQLLLAQR